MRGKLGWLVVLIIFGLTAITLAGADKDWKDVSAQVGDLRIHYVEAGTGERHMVLIPTLTMTAEAWKEQIPYFAARGFHVVAIDPRGHGLTSKTESGNTYQQHAADLHAFLEKTKMEHCTLMAWGTGILTAIEYVSSPEATKPDALVLVDEAPISASDKDNPSSYGISWGRETLHAMQDDRAKATDAMIRSWFKAPMNEMLGKTLSDASKKTPTGVVMALLLDLMTGDRRPVLSRVVMATLIVVPQNRQLFGEYLQSNIPGAKLKTLDAGHALMMEKPQAFNQAVEEFLGQE
jgi:pimeloyl-ACP methyl ester carboxylesterase